MYQGVPNPVDLWTSGGGAMLAEQYPDEVQNAAVMFGNFSATIDTKDKVLEAFPNIGWNFLDCPQEYNLNGEPDWRPFVQQLEDCGAEAGKEPTERSAPPRAAFGRGARAAG